MKIQNYALAFCLLLMPFVSVAQAAKELFEGKVSAATLQNDVDKIYKDLKQYHPNLYRFTDKRSLDNKFDSLKATIKDPLTRMEFRYKVLTVLERIGDGHMTLIMNGSHIDPQDYNNYIGNNITPIKQFDFKVIDSRLYILSSPYRPDFIPGTEIISINGLPATEAIKKMLDGICSDGYNNTFKIYSLNLAFSNIYENTFGRQESVNFEIENSDGKKMIQVNSAVPIANSNQSLPFPGARSYFSKNKSVATLIMGSFENNFQMNYQPFFDNLKTYGTKTLILDLRNNSGGEQANVTKLFSFLITKPAYFAKVPKEILQDARKTPSESMKYGIENKVNPAKNFFLGKIYILINGGSFSATAILIASLKSLNNEIVLVGEETGGGREGCTGGIFRQTNFSGSNLMLRYGEIPFSIFKNSAKDGKGVMPDIPIKYTIADYLSNRDLEMEQMMTEIKSE